MINKVEIAQFLDSRPVCFKRPHHINSSMLRRVLISKIIILSNFSQLPNVPRSVKNLSRNLYLLYSLNFWLLVLLRLLDLLLLDD